MDRCGRLPIPYSGCLALGFFTGCSFGYGLGHIFLGLSCTVGEGVEEIDEAFTHVLAFDNLVDEAVFEEKF